MSLRKLKVLKVLFLGLAISTVCLGITLSVHQVVTYDYTSGVPLSTAILIYWVLLAIPLLVFSVLFIYFAKRYHKELK